VSVDFKVGSDEIRTDFVSDTCFVTLILDRFGQWIFLAYR
jgi:hypothetical protein